MHQYPVLQNEASRSAHVDVALRQSIRRALARDLHLPEQHDAVSATMAALEAVSLDAPSLVAESEPVLIEHVPDDILNVSIETWCCVAAFGMARNRTERLCA